MPSRIAPEVEKENGELILEQLGRITGSKSFQQVDRLKRLLNFVVRETLDGRGDQLKEFVLGVQVFDRGESFDPRTDPIVRVVARRLRSRLARYYREEGSTDEMVIELPKGGYSAVFKRIEAPQTKRSVTSALVSRNSILVLPFSDDSTASDLEYFCRGLRGEIIHALAPIEKLRVVASDIKTGGLQVDSRQSAALIVCGSVRKAAGMFRVTAQLVDAASGCYLWTSVVEGGPDDEFVIQERVARGILSRLQTGLSDGGNGKWPLRPSENLAAHNLYLQGVYHLTQRTEEGLKRAVEFFERVIVEDSQYVLAYCGLADAYGLLNHYGILSPMEVWTKTATNAAWAVLQDDSCPEAHTSLAHVKATQDWDWTLAEREFQRAIGLNPRHPTAHHWYATSCLVPMGRLDEALEEMRIAQSLDPVSSIIARDLAMMLLYRRDFEGALEQCDHTIELNPHFAPGYSTLALVQEQLGDFDESLAALQRAIQLSPDPRKKAALARVFALRGMRADALAILEELQTLSRTRYLPPFDLALIYFALDETDRGFGELASAFHDRSFELIYMKADPRLIPFRDDARFIALCDQLGLA